MAEIRDQVRAELLAEMEAEQKKEAGKRNAVTPSLASSRNAGGGNNESIPEDMTVDDILEG